MKRKKILQARMKRLQARKEKLVARANESEDVKEVRSIYEQLKEVVEDLKDVEEELNALLEDEDNEGDSDTSGSDEKPNDEERSGDMPPAEVRGASIVGAYRQNPRREDTRRTDPADTMEYRTAFMNYVCRGTQIPENLTSNIQMREAAVTTTTDAGAVIPTTIWNEIIQQMESYGNVYALVTKLNVQGGLSIPILSLKPEATWIGETTPSESKKISSNDSIVFNYYGIECKIAQTLLASVVTLDAFQKLFVPLATEAIVKALEIAIFNGTGINQPLGITKDKRIKTTNVISISESDMSWAGWHKVKAKMKKAYRKGTFFMNQATFDEKIDGMEDKNGQPIGRTNYGIDGEETYRFMGKQVETVEDECLPSFDEAAEGEVFAVFMLPKDYIVNSNMQMQVVKWVDNDTNEIKNKCIMICDGKLADVNGVLLIKKGKTVSPAQEG